MTPAVAASIQGYLTTLAADQRQGIEGLRIMVRLSDDTADRIAVHAALDEFNAAGGS